MIKAKLPIKLILSNWYILLNSESLDVIDAITPVQNAVLQMSTNSELDDLDLMILDTYQQGYNYEEIAILTKMTRQTISSKINRIVARIKVLAGEEYE